VLAVAAALVEGCFFGFLSPTIFLVNYFSLPGPLHEVILASNILFFWLFTGSADDKLREIDRTDSRRSMIWQPDSSVTGVYRDEYKKHLAGMPTADIILRAKFIQMDLNRTKYKLKKILLEFLDDVLKAIASGNYVFAQARINHIAWIVLTQVLTRDKETGRNGACICQMLSRIRQRQLLDLPRAPLKMLLRLNQHATVDGDGAVIFTHRDMQFTLACLAAVLDVVEQGIVHHPRSGYTKPGFVI